MTMSPIVLQVGKHFVHTIRCISSYNKQLFDKIRFDEAEEVDEQLDFGDKVPHGIPRERAINDIMLLGRVGRDPVLITAMNYKSYALFYLATRSLRANKERGTDWHEVVCYEDKFKEYIVNNVKQGDRVFVQGTLNYLRPPPRLNVPYNKARILARQIIITKRKNTTEENLDT